MVAAVVFEDKLSRLDPAEEALDLVRTASFHGSFPPPPIGDGSGVMSAIAESCGDDIVEPGDRAPLPGNMVGL